MYIHMCLLCGIYAHLWLVIRGTLYPPRADAVLSRGLSIISIILSAFFSISKNVLTLRFASFMSFDSTVAFGMMVAYVFGIY